MQAVLLAAGASSRFWPLMEDRHKSLFVLMGKPLLQWTLESVQRAGVQEAIVVQGPERHAEAALAGAHFEMKVCFVIQPQPKGMGDALLCAEPLLKDRFFLLHPYHFDAEDFLPRLAAQTKTPIVLSAQRTERPWNYGVLQLDGQRAVRLVEKPERGKEPSKLRVMGFYCLSKSFFDDYRTVQAHQYAFEDALQRCMDRGQVSAVEFDQETPSLKHPWDALHAARLMLQRFVKGQTIDPSAQVDETVVIKGDVFIGSNVKIFEHAVIKGPCYIGSGCIIGTGSLVRDHAILEEDVLIGAHCEVTRSVFGKGASTHSGFFGDSIFCAGAKAGAGTITANVRVDRKEIKSIVKGQRTPTGLTSLGAIVGENTALGIHTMLMPGVLIGSNCLVGPGETVAGSVPSGARVFASRD